MKKKAAKAPTKPTIKREWRARFLDLLANTFSVTAAAKGAGIDRTSVYDARRADPEFATQWDAALSQALDNLEAAAYKRAAQTSDTLAIFLLKTRRPDIYRDRQETTNINIDYSNLTDEQLQRIANGEHPASVITSTNSRG